MVLPLVVLAAMLQVACLLWYNPLGLLSVVQDHLLPGMDLQLLLMGALVHLDEAGSQPWLFPFPGCCLHLP